MLRESLSTLLIAVVLLAGGAQAQRGGGGRGGGVGGFHTGRAGLRSGGFGRNYRRPYNNDNYGLYPFLYGDDAYGYDDGADVPYANDQGNAEAANMPPPPVMMQPPWARQRRVAASAIIDVPGTTTNASPAKSQPAAIFVFASGERLEARRYLLTADKLTITVDRNERVVPLSQLDIRATIAANHDRGLALKIPTARNEITLGF